MGIDNSYKFSKEYMSLMAEKITDEIEINVNQKSKAEEYYVGYERIILVEGVRLKICLQKSHFDQIVQHEMEVQPENSYRWIRECVVGRITKFELDEERAEESNSLDFMQNFNIAYHMDSLIEMQVCI